MGKSKNEMITVQGTQINVVKHGNEDYVSLTDMAKYKGGSSRAADIIKNWIRSRTTLEFLGTWEHLYNPDFKVVEFDHLKTEADLLNVALFGKAVPIAPRVSSWILRLHYFVHIIRMTCLEDVCFRSTTGSFTES